MHEITLPEIYTVSGGGSLLGALDGAINGTVFGFTAGMIIAGKHGGDGGGILGVGEIGQLVGLFAGSLIGGAAGFVDGITYGFVAGPDKVNTMITSLMNGVFQGHVSVIQ